MPPLKFIASSPYQVIDLSINHAISSRFSANGELFRCPSLTCTNRLNPWFDDIWMTFSTLSRAQHTPPMHTATNLRGDNMAHSGRRSMSRLPVVVFHSVRAKPVPIGLVWFGHGLVPVFRPNRNRSRRWRWFGFELVHEPVKLVRK